MSRVLGLDILYSHFHWVKLLHNFLSKLFRNMVAINALRIGSKMIWLKLEFIIIFQK
jgi:hypothetical protein